MPAAIDHFVLATFLLLMFVLFIATRQLIWPYYLRFTHVIEIEILLLLDQHQVIQSLLPLLQLVTLLVDLLLDPFMIQLGPVFTGGF